jgi:hypothetical protein
MAYFTKTLQSRTLQAKTFVNYLTNATTGSFYLLLFKGNAYPSGDTSPIDLPVTDLATIQDVSNPLAFKKINYNGSDSKMKYVIPDSANGTINLYGQKYKEIDEADIFINTVRHIYIEVLIPANDILVSGPVRGVALVADIIDPVSGDILTGDKYLASEVDLESTNGNWLVYIENIEKYERVASEGGELIKMILSF